VTRLFGTDGIRGVANQPPLTPELAFRLGRAAVIVLQAKRASKVQLVVGRDTRLSGPLLEHALISGALSAGGDCLNAGVLPTPAVACLTQQLKADGGVMISASHNSFEDNGIKFFGPEGMKLPDPWEAEIEALVESKDDNPRPIGHAVGRLVVYDRAETDYLAFCRRAFPGDLGGVTVALDCAHGANFRVAPRLFRSLGARVLPLGVRPNGVNINRRSGALYPEALQKKVRASGAQIGLAFDGDGDRLITVDETGEVRDGDFLLAICGRYLASHGRLPGSVIVTTLMANFGLERSLGEAGIRVVKTPVGDRYVLDEMRRIGAFLGGEQSGHLIFLDHAPTGDGIVSALQLLLVMKETGEPLSALSRCLEKFPQVLVNVRVRSKPPIEELPRLMSRVGEMEAAMNGRGRILVRYSGTEPLARVMIEGEDRDAIETMAQELAQIITFVIGEEKRRWS
jgi:phosphoglucosamine mutase